ncbi:GNAT family N-acetyltransferase [Pedobacter arcticus]|uniref:GNAT family N-acetyltransferase n=1 Tax=Pedobacter arcticus TaxID=752140 RepID=UPI0002EA2133|nr:GNAT family N-acetyltransferase [Pedobacter arcticus]
MKITVNWQPQHLDNYLVTLVPLKDYDFRALYEVASDPLIWEQHPSFNRYKKDVFRRFFKKALQSNSAFIIIDSQNHDVIGSSRFYDYVPENKTVAIGYTFMARKYWGTAVNRALKTLMINYAFEQGIENLIFHIGATNLRSQKAVEKLGAVKIKEFTKRDNGVENRHFEFAINHIDWNKQKLNDSF